jgi:nickel/cobalt transporter (NiCoT) family protein
MSFFDTMDGCFKSAAAAGHSPRPVRKVYYDLVITGLSIAGGAVICLGPT